MTQTSTTGTSSMIGASGLQYTISPAQTPVSSASDGSTPNRIDLSVTVANPTTGPIDCTSFVMLVPVGTDSTDLSAAMFAATPSTSTTAWVMRADPNGPPDGVQFKAFPVGGGTLAPQAQVTFTLSGVPVSSVTGTSQIQLTMTTDRNTDRIALPVQKVESSFNILYFRSNSLEVNHGASVTLSWACSSDHATCTLFTPNDPNGRSVAATGSSPNEAPASTTTYTLKCQQDDLLIIQQLTVTVLKLDIPVSVMHRDQPLTPIQRGERVLLVWRTQQATQCVLNPGAITLPPANLAPAQVSVLIQDSTTLMVNTWGADDNPTSFPVKIPQLSNQLEFSVTAIDVNNNQVEKSIHNTLSATIDQFSLSPPGTVFSPGDQVTLSWRTHNAVATTLDLFDGNGPRPVDAIGSKRLQVPDRGSYTVTLAASGFPDSASSRLTIATSVPLPFFRMGGSNSSRGPYTLILGTANPHKPYDSPVVLNSGTVRVVIPALNYDNQGTIVGGADTIRVKDIPWVNTIFDGTCTIVSLI